MFMKPEKKDLLLAYITLCMMFLIGVVLVLILAAILH